MPSSSPRCLRAGVRGFVAKGQDIDDLVTADIITNDQISRAEDYKPLVIGYNHGAAIRLSDVADVNG